MAAFNEERAPSCAFGRWGSVAMVETEDDSREKAVRGAGREQESELMSPTPTGGGLACDGTYQLSVNDLCRADWLV